MDSVLIRNGRIVTATDDYRADILAEDGRVRMIGRDIPVGANVTVHDAGGVQELPRGKDDHQRLDWGFRDSRPSDTIETRNNPPPCGGTPTLPDYAHQH